MQELSSISKENLPKSRIQKKILQNPLKSSEIFLKNPSKDSRKYSNVMKFTEPHHIVKLKYSQNLTTIYKCLFEF